MVYLEVGLVIVLVLLLLAGVMTSIIQAAWCDTGGYGGIRGDTPPPAPVYLPTHDPRHLRSPARGRS